MNSTSLVHPHKVFSRSPPPPPLWKKNVSSSHHQTWYISSLQWRESTKDLKTLTPALGRLQTALRSVHKRRIIWPVEESLSPNLSPSEYLVMLLHPIADLFNQLQSPGVLKTPMKAVSIDLGESVFGATFVAKEFQRWRMNAPIIVYLSDELFSSEGRITAYAQRALSKVLVYAPSTPSIIVTNFKDMAVFFPPTWEEPEPIFERVLTTRPSLTLRVVSAAYLYREVPPHVNFINTPDPDLNTAYESDVNPILPGGPPQNPKGMLPDEEVFATCHRNSDFDQTTLIQDSERTLQFFRWRAHVKQHYAKLVAHPGDTLTATTNDIGWALPRKCPVYQFDTSELPEDTENHLKSVQRESPLVAAGIHELFVHSKSFTLEIQSVVSEGTERGICTVYRCLITSINGNPAQSPSLCLKLFDDRFQVLPNPYDNSELGELLHCWFDYVVRAEAYALNEAAAYDKLRPVQGSVVPWFYGCHEFTLPCGTILTGLLMEYIEGQELASDFTRTVALGRQINIIQSCRHAARTLDIADIGQRDWHAGQVLIFTNPNTKLDHAIMIDFASTTQTWELHKPNLLDNYFHLLCVLLDTSGLDPELVWKHFGEPDDWDPIMGNVTVASTDNDSITVKARDMFPYISSVKPRNCSHLDRF